MYMYIYIYINNLRHEKDLTPSRKILKIFP